jgi:hypothetical protein
MKTSINLPAALAAVATFFFGACESLAAPRTMNIDLGNAGPFAGEGVLSSPGGTHWNELTIQSFPPNSGISMQVMVPPLRDEFGQLIPHAEFFSTFHLGQENTAPAAPPLNDGVHLESGVGFWLRSFVPGTLIDLVVYFNNPVSPQGDASTINVGSFVGFGITETASNPTGAFPGIQGRDYLRFNGLPPQPTTLDDQDTRPGVILRVPVDSSADIAAIQIRGEFVPEPASWALTITAAYFAAVLFRAPRNSRAVEKVRRFRPI